MQSNFLGKSGFYWWMGTIENRVDPLGLNRCQVRIFGYHGDGSDQSKLDIPPETLPWAQSLVPINNAASMNGIPPIGTWVVGFFLDGESAQYPIIMGAIPGYLPKPDNTFTAINMQSTPV